MYFFLDSVLSLSVGWLVLLGRKQKQGLRISLMVFLKLLTSGLPPEVQLIAFLLNPNSPALIFPSFTFPFFSFYASRPINAFFLKIWPIISFIYNAFFLKIWPIISFIYKVFQKYSICLLPNFFFCPFLLS